MSRPGTTISFDGDRKLLVSDLDKTKLIQYHNSDSTTVDVEEIYYKQSSTVTSTVIGWNYKNSSTTTV